MFVFQLEETEANLVIGALAELPFKVSAGLIGKLQQQAKDTLSVATQKADEAANVVEQLTHELEQLKDEQRQQVLSAFSTVAPPFKLHEVTDPTAESPESQG